MSASNQQTLADSGANERPSMLEKGNYIPWESRFRRILDKKLKEGERMWHSIKKGPYDMVEMVTGMQGDKTRIKHLMQEIGMMKAIRLFSVFHKLSQIRGKANVQCYNCNEKGHYARDCQKPRVHDAKYFREQMLLAMKDVAGSNLNAKENDFMLDNSFGDELHEVNASHKVHEQVNYVKCKTIIHTSDDDQIDSNIIFDGPYVENNGGTSEHDSNAHANIMIFRFWHIMFKEKKLSSHDRVVYKMGQSIQTNHVLIKTPNKVYDPFFKAGLGYQNSKRRKKAIALQPKMYHGEMLYKNKLKIDSHDPEETLEDAEESRLKMRNKMVQLDYEKLNALYETFIPQKEPSVEQTYFSFPSTSHECVESSNSVRRSKSKDTKSKNGVLNNTNDKSSSAHVRKVSISVSIDSNKRETMNSTVCQSNASVLNIKNVNVVNECSNIVCVSCGKDVFMLSHEKCVARYALSSDYKVIQLVLWIVDSGCSKHMTGNLKLLRNFIKKFMGTVHFGNNLFATITGYGDYVQGNLTICHVYYVEGLGYNLFSVGQFCDGDLKVAFCSSTCYVRNLEGDNLLTGSQESNLYTISIFYLAASSPVCLMSKATSTKSWLWHRRLSYFYFGTINQLTSKDLVDGLPKFKYDKDHLCLACEQGKIKKASFPPKLVPSTEPKLKLLHMNLCGLMRVESINGKKYILVIVDDYSRYTWIYFLHTKDEAPDMIINFINQVQRNLKAQILKIRTDNETAEAIATTCFTQNPSLVHTRYNKTPYELTRGRKPNVQYFHVFGSLCYPKNDRDDLGKMKSKADICILIGYSESSRGFRIYNRQTKKIMETIHVKFDELASMASECNNSGPGLNCLNFQDSSKELIAIPLQQDWDNLFGPLYEEYYAPSTFEVLNNSAANTLDDEDTTSPSLIIVEDSDAPHIVPSSEEPITQESSTPVLETHSDEQIQKDVAELDGNTIMHSFEIPEFEEAESSSNYQDPSNMHKFHQQHRYTDK
ncbi:retrovirus-related pol polyprotein from transposon TNT 1-94 [Tanacetum coccineum]